jgi:hypothetical protein
VEKCTTICFQLFSLFLLVIQKDNYVFEERLEKDFLTNGRRTLEDGTSATRRQMMILLGYFSK